ncbi:MAG: hypothetical protein CVU55_09830 [Deltaproteobacteria bacterium HGW-Deltaproteobacteria-13]|jgi:hypothetical protein|nr:MAG: hypothetical protein CVU55_09830 [Deltaproteobacteria bacterium HGW-Deltaproteobacteria-13]
MRTKFPKKYITTQTIGNIGLFYVCYELSLFGWNVLPTSRNAKGVDIIIFSQNASRKLSIQVKTLSKRNPVPLGTNLDNFFADYVVICVRNSSNEPVCYVMTPGEVRDLAHKGEKDGKVSYWLQPRAYENDKYKENWKRIGHGVQYN